MAYTRVRYRVPRDQCESLSHALQQLEALSVSVENAGGPEHFDSADAQEPEWAQVTVIGLFAGIVDPGAIHRALDEDPLVTVGAAPQVDTLAEQDWQRASIEQFKPLQVARGIWICPSWTTPPDPGAINIVLDPGLAFGTGSHATTAMCLQWLADAELAGKTVVDYGCGSGILALAALKLGASRVIALDIDPRALQVTRENARRNRLGDARLEVMPPEQLPHNTQADILLANILAGTLVDLAPALIRMLAANGTILLSGILEPQMALVRAAFEPAFTFAKNHREEWCLLVGKRRTGVAVQRAQ